MLQRVSSFSKLIHPVSCYYRNLLNQNIMENNEKLIDSLNHLVAICNDGKFGYETAAEDAESSELKSMFTGYSTQRAEYASQLKEYVRSSGGDPDKDGGPLGALHRAWIDVKSALSSKDNKAVLGACITGEKAAIEAYDDVLNDSDINLPVNIREMLITQRNGIQEALNRVNSLHETVNS